MLLFLSPPPLPLCQLVILAVGEVQRRLLEALLRMLSGGAIAVQIGFKEKVAQVQYCVVRPLLCLFVVWCRPPALMRHVASSRGVCVCVCVRGRRVQTAIEELSTPTFISEFAQTSNITLTSVSVTNIEGAETPDDDDGQGMSLGVTLAIVAAAALGGLCVVGGGGAVIYVMCCRSRESAKGFKPRTKSKDADATGGVELAERGESRSMQVRRALQGNGNKDSAGADGAVASTVNPLVQRAV